MADMFYLTSEDLSLFREMAQDFRARKRGQQLTSSPYTSPQAPDVYLAKVPPGGIPALSQEGTTGTGTDQPLDDTPGSVECEIYQLDTEEAVPTFGRVGELTYIVRNLSPSAISADRTPWVLVVRDKFGEWFVAGGEASSGGIEFEDFSDSITVVTGVTQTSCGLSIQSRTFTFDLRLPVGSSFSISDGGTGTGTVGESSTEITFDTRLVDIPTSANFVFDSATCTGTITFVTTPICLPSIGITCCPDYTGTGTS